MRDSDAGDVVGSAYHAVFENVAHGFFFSFDLLDGEASDAGDNGVEAAFDALLCYQVFGEGADIDELALESLEYGRVFLDGLPDLLVDTHRSFITHSI